MLSVPLRNACSRFTEELCAHTLIYTVGSFLALWLIASFSLLPVGIGIYVGFDKHIGAILMITGSVCLFITLVYAMSLKFFEYYRQEQAKEARRGRQFAGPVPAVVPTPATVAIPVSTPAVATAPTTAPTTAPPPET
jgi:hypothetical protein